MKYQYKEGIDKQWFLMTVMPMRYPGRGVVISHEDITVRKRHEQAIHELNGRLINAQEEEHCLSPHRRINCMTTLNQAGSPCLLADRLEQFEQAVIPRKS